MASRQEPGQISEKKELSSGCGGKREHDSPEPPVDEEAIEECI